jgi:glycosyltransferase involved in cell wall biosynthesis
MRIAIDARELQGQPTGVGRVLAGILDAWETMPEADGHEFVLCSATPLEAAGRGPRFQYLSCPRPRNSTLWEQLTLPRLVGEGNADVLFAPAYTGPLASPVRMVTAVYDVSFAAHPEWFGAREGFRRRLLTGMSARRAARVVTSSEFSRGEIARYLRVDPRNVDVAYPGIPAMARSPATVDRDNLVLFVGSLFTRRHLGELIEGFGGLARRQRDVRLEIVGDNRTKPRLDFDRLAAASGVADRIALRSYVEDRALAALYSRAKAFVFLSEYEGFGLTPLEALAAGVPIVVLDTPIAREVYGDAALYLPAPEPALIHAALDRLLRDDAERARILTAAKTVLPRYSWNSCASVVLNTLVRAAG